MFCLTGESVDSLSLLPTVFCSKYFAG
ncbi:hypothetical protein [Lelliottia amnigena]